MRRASMRRFCGSAATALVLVLTAAAPAPDPAPSAEPLALGVLVKSSFTTPRGRTVSVESAVFPRDRVTLRVVDWPFGGPRGEVVRRSVYQGVLAAIDGGFVGPGFRPDGLLEIGGRVHEPLRSGRSGVVGSARDDSPVVAPVGTVDTAQLRDAIQTGPFVVDPGGSLGIRRDDGERARRSLVIVSDEQFAVAITSECGLYDLGAALVRSPRAFGVERVERALNLSGGPSSGIAVRRADGSVESVPERIRLRTVLTVVAR